MGARSSGRAEAETLSVAGPRDRDLESAQGAVPAGRAHEARSRCAITWRSPMARCARPVAGRTCSCAIRTASARSSSIRSARRRRAPPGSTSSRCASLPAAPPKKSCRATRRRSRGWPTSPASSCIRIRCAPTTSIIRTSCASISIRCRASRGRRSARSRASCAPTLDDFGLVGWPKTSGSRGIHVYVRIERRWTFDEVRRAALALAREVERRAPALATSKWWKEERHGVFLDYNQNAKDRTVAAAYSVRPTPDARVSAPLAWDEIDACEPADFTLATMPARFADDRRPPRRTSIEQPCSLERAARALGAAGARRAGRRAVAAALQEAGGRAAARAAVEAADADASADRDRRARGRRTMRSRASSAGRRATPRRPRTCSRPTSWSTRCAAGFARGRASA